MEVKLILTAEDKTQQVFSAVKENSKSSFDQIGESAVKSAETTKSTWNLLKEHWLGVTAAITAAWVTVSKAWNFAYQPAQFQEQKSPLNNLASSYNTTADAIINSVREASDGLISMSDSTKVASKALMMGLNPEQITNFMKIVKDTTNITGQSVSQAFEQITEAAATGRERTLKQMGIIVDLNGAYKNYASTVNKTVDELTEQEKQQAAVNTILDKGSSILEQLGDQGDSTADKMERFGITIEDLKLKTGEYIVRGAYALYAVLQKISSAALITSGGIYDMISAGGALTDFLHITSGAYDNWRINAKAAYEAAADLYIKSEKNFSNAFSSIESTAKKTSKAVSSAVKESANSIAESANSIAESAKKEKELLGEVIKGLESYSSAIQKLGVDILKFAGEDFTKNFEAQKKSITGMQSALKDYIEVINEVYSQQLDIQKSISDAMKNLGADPKTMMEQNKAILEIEKSQSEQRLSAWTGYYNNLKSLHSSAIEEQKKKTQELLSLEENIKKQRQGYADLELSLKEKLMTETEKYYSTQSNLEDKYSAAMQLSGQEKIDALTTWQQAVASSVQEVKDGDSVVISMQYSVVAAYYKVKEAQELILLEQRKIKDEKISDIEQTKKWAESLQSAVNTAQGEIVKYSEEITALSKQMSSLNLYIDNNQAVDAISKVQAALNSIPEFSYKYIVLQTISGDVSASYASGTSYVPETGLYQLHQGERVLNRNESANYDNRKYSNQIIFSPVIKIKGNNIDPKILAKKIVKPLRDELGRLEIINN